MTNEATPAHVVVPMSSFELCPYDILSQHMLPLVYSPLEPQHVLYLAATAKPVRHALTSALCTLWLDHFMLRKILAKCGYRAFELKSQPLEIYVTDKAINDSDLRLLSRWIIQQGILDSVHTLFLDDNKIGDDGIQCLASAIERGTA